MLWVRRWPLSLGCSLLWTWSIKRLQSSSFIELIALLNELGAACAEHFHELVLLHGRQEQRLREVLGVILGLLRSTNRHQRHRSHRRELRKRIKLFAGDRIVHIFNTLASYHPWLRCRAPRAQVRKLSDIAARAKGIEYLVWSLGSSNRRERSCFRKGRIASSSSLIQIRSHKLEIFCSRGWFF